MAIAQSKVTAKGRISVPAEIRKRLGLGPGSVVEWDKRSGEVVVRKAGRYPSAEVHQALFGAEKARRKPGTSVKAGIRKYVRRRHARA